MRDEIALARDAGRRYVSAADPQRFRYGMTERGMLAAFRAYVRETPAIAPFVDQFMRAARAGE